MMKPTTPRQLREEIEGIDSEPKDLTTWERTLTTARNRYVLADEPEVVNLIEHGPQRQEGRPPDSDLEPFDVGHRDCTRRGRPSQT